MIRPNSNYTNSNDTNSNNDSNSKSSNNNDIRIVMMIISIIMFMRKIWPSTIKQHMCISLCNRQSIRFPSDLPMFATMTSD